MAKIERGDKLTGGDIRRSKRKLYFRGDGAGGTIAASWPKKRNKKQPNSEIQQAWVDHFKRGIAMAKNADGCTRTIAEGLASKPFSPNYFWRDAIMSAFNGKMQNNAGDGSDPRGRQGPFGTTGVFRVTTPTFNISRATNQSVPSGAGISATFDTVDWDNNLFFDPTQDDRVTIKSKGLYLVGSYSVFETGGAGFRRAILQQLPDGDVVSVSRQTVGLNVTCELSTIGIWYFEAGQQFRLLLQVSGGPVQARARRFFGVGIVPEMVT